MKKFISLTLAAVMVLSMSLFMASCGSSDDGGDADAPETKAVKITGVIATQLGDMSFNDSANAGLNELKEQGFEVKVTECNTDETLYEQSLRTAAESSDVVIGVGSELLMIGTVAKEYPDTKFIWVDNVVDDYADIPNLTCISYKQNEGSYLVGYIAGSMTESNVVGFIGGADIPVINDFYVGYKQGAEQAGKDLNKDVKVIKGYTGDWSDTNLGAEHAQDQASKGADIIFCAAGGSGNGAIMKAKELGIKCIGVDQDQRITMSKYADEILCSMIKNVQKSIVDYVKDFTSDDSKWIGGRVFYAGSDGEYVKVAYGPEDADMLVPEDVIKALDEQMAKITAGDIVVDTVF
ncbi:BMP family ABC transporter substrate-binding protein [Emergencia sp. 1XD21-10]|uniref:BMP family ABC transporter substrate-binding protein n=1 Tax=Emergencia sp. 1XD21-10 TaxID=2304569 RepID=UPI00137ABA59|nr:BMP family ABC transporter substrate-binding protein [Emergencia sp. 1XD21-10]MCI9639714.1 BMP family ABC transporter substrate-binding protein [Emergencia sp.]